MARLYFCRQPFFRYKNPKYKEFDKNGIPIPYEKMEKDISPYLWTKATSQETDLVVQYATAVKQGDDDGNNNKNSKDFKKLEQRYLKEIAEHNGDGATYHLCESQRLIRIYHRSRSKKINFLGELVDEGTKEPEPKIIKQEAGELIDGTKYYDEFKIRRRQFIPFGWYCLSCETFMTDKQYDALEVEQRKVPVGFGIRADGIRQGGYDNGGYFTKPYYKK